MKVKATKELRSSAQIYLLLSPCCFKIMSGGGSEAIFSHAQPAFSA